MPNDSLKAPSPTHALEHTAPAQRPPPGQLGTFAVLGAAVGTVPLPWLPDALARRLRGALVHDIAARHGLALGSEARLILADPDAAKKKRGAVAKAFAFLTRKLLVRFGPLGLLPPLRAALETYILGYLFDRYLSRGTRSGQTRLEADEARVVRDAIERAVLRVVSIEGDAPWPTTPVAPEDSRDEITQALDGILSATATVPSWLQERLAAAFDESLVRP